MKAANNRVRAPDGTLATEDICTLMRFSRRKLDLMLADPTADFPRPFRVAGSRRHLWLQRTVHDYLARLQAAASGANALTPEALRRVA